MDAFTSMWSLVCDPTMSVWASFMREMDYFRTGKILENLKTQAQRLHAIKAEMETVSTIPENEYWLQVAEDLERQVKDIDEGLKENKLGGRLPYLHILARRNLGKHIVTLEEEILQHYNEGSELIKRGPVVDELQQPQPEEVEAVPATTIDEPPKPQLEEVEAIPATTIDEPPQAQPVEVIPATTNYDYKEPIRRNVERVLECVRDLTNVQRIGVWGVGGVGKTTVMQQLKNLPEITQMFEVVIWVTASKTLNVRNLQNKIAQQLKMELKSNSEEAVARELLQHLATKKYLLILEDVREAIELEKIGVPRPSDENKCKIILTSASLDVCRQMHTDKEIKLEVLSKEQAWKLFSEIVGERVVGSPTIEPIATRVAKKCRGLPLAVKVIGRSLRNKHDVRRWRHALRDLKSKTTAQKEDEVLAILKFGYDRLENDNLKKCFLYAALYPEDYAIDVDELIDHWWAEGFIANGSWGNARQKGITFVNQLTDACLLEKIECGYRSFRVKMHDTIRDLALYITSLPSLAPSRCNFLVRANAGLNEFPDEVEWRPANKISLMDNQISSLPDRPKCSSSLSTLLLQRFGHLKVIPMSFFEHMQGLGVLDLSRTNIRKLPPSVSKLIGLRGLFLWECTYLTTLPSQVEALTSLEVLHVGPYVEHLPAEVGKLTHLRSLWVIFRAGRRKEDEDDDDEEEEDDDDEEEKKMIPEGMLAELSQLEDLIIYAKGFVSYKFQNKWIGVAKALAREATSLVKLTRLGFLFPSVDFLERFLRESLSWKNQCLKSFFLEVTTSDFEYVTALDSPFNWGLDTPNDDFDLVPRIEGEQSLMFEGGDSIPYSIVDLLGKASFFQLVGHKTAETMSSFSWVEGLKHLECCILNGCNAMKTMLNLDDAADAILQNVKILRLLFMLELRTILEGPALPPESFSSLKYLNIQNCPRLKHVFRRSSVLQLPNLETVDIANCIELEEIVKKEDKETKDDSAAVVMLPKLKVLKIKHLPKLARICKPDSLAKPPSLETITVVGCQNL
ncbi:PREDICTED: probable disease resistance protein At4g27220 [Nelumbo nucifera]|uniref:Probable disease resistance protein At4g27220 n=1 Tax=Nelumbo nucifera TaxID=4432 RepID=A0A1U7ZF32_NELNU|nr:PREDICTED: probable disease resistance protein At4g27220 [Nelumbo nucifera]